MAAACRCRFPLSSAVRIAKSEPISIETENFFSSSLWISKGQHVKSGSGHVHSNAFGVARRGGTSLLGVTRSTTASHTHLFSVVSGTVAGMTMYHQIPALHPEIQFFSKMEHNHVETMFPNFGLQANIVKSAHICRFEENLERG